MSYGKAPSCPNIIRRHARPLWCLQRSNMGVGYVQNMNVIAEARSIRGRIIMAENLEEFPFAGYHLQQQRNDVGFWPMILPDGGGPPAGVEVPEGDDLPIVGTCVPTQRTLQHEFSLAVRINR